MGATWYNLKSWAVLGEVLGHLGVVFGGLWRSWAHLRMFLGHVGGSWVALGAILGALGALFGALGALSGALRGPWDTKIVP